MRKIVIIGIAACVVVFLILALLPHFLDANHYRPRIQAELQNLLGRSVLLGDIRLSLLPPALIVKDVEIGEDPRFGGGAFAKAQELSVRVALIPLLRKDLQVKSLRLTNPDIALIKNPSGQWNYASLGQTPTAAQAKPQNRSAVEPERGAQPAPAGRFSLDHLEIFNGRLRVIDQESGVQNTYDNIDLTLANFAPGKSFDVDARVHIAGRGNQQIIVKGTAGFMESGSSAIPFQGNVELQQISLGDLQKVAKIAALEGYNGVASGSLKARADQGVVHAEGSLKIEDPQIKATKLGYPIILDFKIEDDANKGIVRISDGTVSLGPTPVSIAGSMKTTPTPAQLDIRLATRNASLAEIARLAAAAGFTSNTGANFKGTVNADVSVRGSANNPGLSGSVAATGVDISGGPIKQTVSVPQLNLALTPTSISSSPFVTKVGNTQLNMQFALKEYTSQAPSFTLSIKTDNANVGELLMMASAYGLSAVEGMSGSGSMSLNLSAAGPLKNASAMTFNGTGTLQDASLRTPALAKPLNVQHANILFSQNSISLENAQVSLDQSNASGNVSVRNFAAPQVQFALKMDKLDLAALRQVFETSGSTVKKAEFRLVPQAYAQEAAPEPSMITKLTGNGTVDVGTLAYDQLVLNNVKADVTLDHGIIRLSPLTSTMYGGQQTGEIVLDARNTPPAVTVATRLQKVDANRLVSSVSSLKNTLYGLLAANTNVTFHAATGSNFAQSLNGKLELDLSDGRIGKIDMLNQLAQIGRFLNASSAIPQQPFTDVTQLTGTFDVENGVARTNNLHAVIPGVNLAANGTVNLSTNALNLHLTAVMSKDFSQKVGGNSIGGFMQTALANNRGELVIPIILTGTFDNPRFAPDVQEITRMRLQNLVPGFGNGGDIKSGIFGAILGGGKKAGQQQPAAGENPQQNQQQTQPANPVGDLLDSLFKNKKKQKEQPQP